jgi:hypothetical protein
MDYVTNKVGQKMPYGLKYSPQTGMFYRSVKHPNASKSELGPIVQKNRKYMRIMHNRKEYPLHRLAFLFMNVFLPEGEIGGTGTVVDHINGNTHDNRWENLRLVEKRENDQNKKAHREGRKCGVNESSKTKGRWEARIVIDKKRHHIGTYGSEEEAYKHYLKAIDDWNNNGIKPQRMEEKRKYYGIRQMPNGSWRSRIGIKGKYYELGSYADKEEAFRLYLSAKDRWNNDGILPE